MHDNRKTLSTSDADRLHDDVLYTTREAARFLGRSHRTLELWRRLGLGPRVTRLHPKALPHYRGRDLRLAIEGNRGPAKINMSRAR